VLQKLEPGEYQRVLPIFRGYLEDPLLYAGLEGRRDGRAWVDDLTHPVAAFVWPGTECAYLAGGDADTHFHTALRHVVLAEVIPALESAGRDFLSLFSFPGSYADTLEALFAAQLPLKTALNTFTFDSDTFLERHSDHRALPPGFRLQAIDASVLAAPEHTPFAEEVAYHWGSVDRFLEDGCGYCVLEGSRMVSWCYAQAFGHASQTLDIWTSSDRRRKGLGTAVAAALIGHCLAAGYDPFWLCDDGNIASRRLALSLGFDYAGNLHLVDIPFQPFDFYRSLAAHFYMPLGRHKQAAECYDRAFSVQEGTATDHYQAALAWARAGDGDRALAHLQHAVDYGWQGSMSCAESEIFAPWRETEPWLEVKRWL
jgi:GNAT superfamily N-acetyltransferase